MDIENNIHQFRKRIAIAAERADRSPAEIILVAVTKTIAAPLIKQAFQAGIRHFGENRVQEAKIKFEELSSLHPAPEWHMIGHLQRNKVKTAVALFDMIQSVDSVILAEDISRHSQRDIPILLQVNMSEKAGRFGFLPKEIPAAMEKASRLPHLDIRGLMTVAPVTDDPEEIRPIFRQTRLLCNSLGLEHLSMGMSDDFEVAIEEGATILRIGRAIFGERKD